jgi:hypothetical protein
LAEAKASVQKLISRHPQALLVGDGFSIYRDGGHYLEELVAK